MIAVIDANIAVALTLDLAYSEEARKALSPVTEMIAPDLVVHEVANTIWKIALREPQLAERGQQTLALLPILFADLVPGKELAQEALTLALATRHPAYDCFYLALARQRKAQLITADRKLANAAALADPKIQVTLVKGPEP